MPSRTLGYYEEAAGSLADRYERADVKQLHQELLAALEGHSPLLELGCGSGREAAFLTSKGFEVVATDGSPSMLEEAKRLHPELARTARVMQVPSHFPFQSGTFAGVYAVAVLMHLDVDDITLVLEEIWRVLCGEGRLLLSIPLSGRNIGLDGRDDKGRRFTKLPEEEWRELFHNTGFNFLKRSESADGLGRQDIQWLTFALEKGNRAEVACPRPNLVW